MTPAMRLMKRLREMGLEIDPNAIPHSLRTGPNARAAGAWSWYVDGPGQRITGSQLTMTELLRAARLVASWSHWVHDTDIHIDPLPLGRLSDHPEGGRFDTLLHHELWERSRRPLA